MSKFFTGNVHLCQRGCRTLQRYDRSSGTSQITWSLNQYTSRCVNVWRPWSDGPKAQVSAHTTSSNQMKLFDAHQGHFNGKVIPSGFQHPVKLFWPKSRYYDFLYQDAEKLLQNFPVQATISLYQETDGSSSSEEDDFCND
uniref:Protein ripply2 n=1 Tax=Leptobrachium leishanense TaxID=445787 RepID=A0A8C5WG89_9ANUR